VALSHDYPRRRVALLLVLFYFLDFFGATLGQEGALDEALAASPHWNIASCFSAKFSENTNSSSGRLSSGNSAMISLTVRHAVR